MSEQRVENKIIVDGVYRLTDATPEADWSKEEQIRWYKKNIAAALILGLSLLGLAFLSGNKNFEVLSLTMAGSAASVLMNGEAKANKAK